MCAWVAGGASVRYARIHRTHQRNSTPQQDPNSFSCTALYLLCRKVPDRCIASDQPAQKEAGWVRLALTRVW